MQVSISKMSVGLRELLNSTPEHRSRYQWALELVETRSVTLLRTPGAPLAREYSSWHNANNRKGLDPSISTFKDFIRIHGPMPDDGEWSLDRVNPLGPYSPSNIRWASPLAQTRNRTNTLTLNFYGATMYLQDIALILNLSYRQVHKIFSRSPENLVQILENESYAMRYQFPEDFAEELEAAYAENVHGPMRLKWILSFAQLEVLRLSDEVEDAPGDRLLRERYKNAVTVLRHATAFDYWAREQRRKKTAHTMDVRTAGPLPDWEMENLEFVPSPPPQYTDFIQ
ncbi:MAG: hypothetical protein Q4G71_13650 [Pseudomonadota bacterium]|nr:hypothetical protein [Pseudomonadota bacterium]